MSHLGVSPKQYWGLVGGRVRSLLLGVTIYLVGCSIPTCCVSKISPLLFIFHFHTFTFRLLFLPPLPPLLLLFLSSFSFILSAFPPLPLFHTVEYTGIQKQKWSLLLIIISFTCLTLVFTVLWSSYHTCSCKWVSRAEVPVTCAFLVSSSIEGISEAEPQQWRPYPVTGR